MKKEAITTIRIGKSVHLLAKIQAVALGISLKKFIEDLIMEKIDRTKVSEKLYELLNSEI